MLPNKQEFPCQTKDISPGGVFVVGPGRGEVGDKVVLYCDTLGRVEGDIVRLTPEGFGMSINTTQAKRERLADLLTWLTNQETGGSVEDRRHRRIEPRNKDSVMVLATGEALPVEIVDVSLSGAGVRSDVVPELGARVDIGRRAGKVVRQFKGGLAVEFLRLIPIEEFDEDIIL